MKRNTEKERLLKYYDKGIFTKTSKEGEFRFTEKGAALYLEYMNDFVKAISNSGLLEQRGILGLPFEKQKEIIQKGLLAVYKDNMPIIFIEVLDKAKEVGFEAYVKFEFAEPSEKDIFH